MTAITIPPKFDPRKKLAFFNNHPSGCGDWSFGVIIYSSVPTERLSYEVVPSIDVLIGYVEDGNEHYSQQYLEKDIAHAHKSKWLWSGGFGVGYGESFGVFTSVPNSLGEFQRIVHREDDGKTQNERLKFSKAGNEVTFTLTPDDAPNRPATIHLKLAQNKTDTHSVE